MKKKSSEKLIIILTILLFLALLYFFIEMVVKVQFHSTEDALSEDVFQIPEILKNENPVNIDEVIEENRNIEFREEMIYEQQDLEYTTQYIDNENLPTGTIHVSQIGITGTQDVITIKRYSGDELISEKIVASNVKKASIDKIVEIGIGKRKK